MNSQLLKPAAFLDRDGTINFDPGYLSHPDQMKLLPGAGQAIAELKAMDYEIVIISNQSGVGRGLIDKNSLPLIHARMNELLRPYGSEIQHFYLCLHRPEENCPCRKPHALLVKTAAKELGLDLKRSFMAGDKLSDLETARNAELKAAILVRTGTGAETERSLPKGAADHIADSLGEAVKWVSTELRKL